MPHHFAIPIKNLKESKEFYEKLGFVIDGEWEKPDEKLEAIWMKKGDLRLKLVYHKNNVDVKFPKIPEVLHIGIEVDDIYKEVEKLEKMGIKLSKPITKGKTVAYFAFLKDPNGFNIELYEE